MKITNLASATVLVETKGKRILMDPWLDDGIYYGSWSQFPKFDWDALGHLTDNLDAIYVSHIHPDHCSRATMAKIKARANANGRHTPSVLIHRYDNQYLAARIKSMGFNVIEIPHGEPFSLGDGVELTIYAADDCNPELCGMAFGCDAVVTERGSAQIDSLCALSDGKFTLVNTNDCPFGLARQSIQRLKARYPKIDLLMVGYGSAGPYPQCFSMPLQEMHDAAEAKKERFLQAAMGFVRQLKPIVTFPFAGQYMLAGRLVDLDVQRGVPSQEEAVDVFNAYSETRAISLGAGGWYNLSSGVIQAVPSPLHHQIRAYREMVLRHVKFDFDDDPMPTWAELSEDIVPALKRMNAKKEELGIEFKHRPFLTLPDGVYADLSEAEVKYISGVDIRDLYREPYILMTVDPRLLRRLLKGPSQAHWNRAEIGSHIQYVRNPDTYDRGFFRAMHAFHV